MNATGQGRRTRRGVRGSAAARQLQLGPADARGADDAGGERRARDVLVGVFDGDRVVAGRHRHVLAVARAAHHLRLLDLDLRLRRALDADRQAA